MAGESWQYETAEDLDQSLVERLKNFPREPDMLVYGARIATASLLRMWLKVYQRFSVTGREHLPREGSFVMVANHASHLDAMCLLSALPMSKLHRAFPAAAQDYFFVSVPRVAIAAVMMNALPFNRESSIRQSLSLCTSLLETPGNVLVIFPEGTRSKTGELGEFKPGVGLMLAGTNYPVVPCYLDGAYEAWPKGAYVPRPWRVSLKIGAPRVYSHLSRGKGAAVEITADLRRAVEELAGKPSSNSSTAESV